MARAEGPIGTWLSSGVRPRFVPPGIGPLLLALTDPDPAQRPSAAGAGIILRRLEERGSKDPRPSRRQLELGTLSDLRPIADVHSDRVIKDALTAISSLARPSGERFWPATAFGLTTDPRNVQHGVAGVIGALAQSWRCTGDRSSFDVVRQAAVWLADRVKTLPFAPVGLHFGGAGTAWGLFDAGVALGDDRLVGQAVDLALRLPTDWPCPDVTHGRAGLGLTLLHLYELTGDTRLLAAAGRCADSLLRDVEHFSKTQIGWQTPSAFRSTFAGRTFYGFAHGTAGIGTFLLAMAKAGARQDCIDAAGAAASSLVESSTRRDELIGWREGPTSLLFCCRTGAMELRVSGRSFSGGGRSAEMTHSYRSSKEPLAR